MVSFVVVNLAGFLKIIYGRRRHNEKVDNVDVDRSVDVIKQQSTTLTKNAMSTLSIVDKDNNVDVIDVKKN